MKVRVKWLVLVSFAGPLDYWSYYRDLDSTGVKFARGLWELKMDMGQYS